MLAVKTKHVLYDHMTRQLYMSLSQNNAKLVDSAAATVVALVAAAVVVSVHRYFSTSDQKTVSNLIWFLLLLL